ncbi:hypothetical protein G6F35_005247 [Rhizopus arrhizus]|nr:hypothetical protein G6F35_005247 [Rhizopus arrhizus]
MSQAARHDSDIRSSGMNMNTAPIAPDTSTASNARQVTVSTVAAPAAPAATARRRGPRWPGALPSSRFTGRHRLRSTLKRRQPSVPTGSPKMPRDSTYNGARSNSGLHHHIASQAQPNASSHQPSALKTTNSGALASSQLPHTARA